MKMMSQAAPSTFPSANLFQLQCAMASPIVAPVKWSPSLTILTFTTASETTEATMNLIHSVHVKNYNTRVFPSNHTTIMTTDNIKVLSHANVMFGWLHG